MEEKNFPEEISPEPDKNHPGEKLSVKLKKVFYFKKWGLTPKDFKRWGKKGGRPKKYANDKERWKTYRRRKTQTRIDKGEVKGILNMTTGRINKR